MANVESLSGRIRQALDAREIPQGKFADNLGVSSSAVSQWLTNKKEPSREMVRKAAQILDVDSAWLEYGKGQPPTADLNRQRLFYKEKTNWVFRNTPKDGGRDFGNPNLWAVPWDIETLAKETLQNSLDAAIDPDAGIEVVFNLIKLTGRELKDFLTAIKWNEIGGRKGLYDHLNNASQNTQKLGGILRDGLEYLEDKNELILLRIDDFYTNGLTGEEDGEGNFAALCRNNLDSNKSSALSGGAYGLGKAVFWRASRYATVLFCSNLNEPFVDESGNVLQDLRIIAKADLAYHKLDESEYAGPGWFGVSIKDQDEALIRSNSVWGNQALAKDLFLDRGSNSGTSILVIGFQDNSTDTNRSIEDMAAEFGKAISLNFWPALVSHRLSAKINVSEGRTQKLSLVVDPLRYHPFFVDAINKYSRKEISEKLNNEGDIVVRQIPIKIPKKVKDPKHDAVEDECILIVRRASDNGQSDQINCVAYYRGQEMIICYQNLKNLVFGGAPFQAVVLCGNASGNSETDTLAEQFFRNAEPPAHDKWIMTPELKINYAQGSKTNLDSFFRQVREQIRDLIKPTYDSLEDGPEALKELLRLPKIKDIVDSPANAPKIIIDRNKSHVKEDGSWEVHVRIKLPDDRTWHASPVLQFSSESGSGESVIWNITPINGCFIEGGSVISKLNSREMYFVGNSDPASHPIAAVDSAVNVFFSNLQSEAN